MTRDHRRRRLEALGRHDPPPPAPEFADALEQRLRAVHASLPARPHPTGDEAAGATPHSPAAPGRAWWRSPVPVAAALALLLVVSFGAVLRRPAGVELATAFDATVTLPDGTSVPARAGQRLAEGAVVLTGPNGHVEIAGDRLGPDEVAVVRGDRLERVRETRPGPPAPQPTRPPGRGPVAVLPSQPAPRQTPHADEREHVDTEPVAAGMAEPDDRHAIGLKAMARDGRVFVAWTEFRHPDFAFFVVLRAAEGRVPTWPPARGTELLGRTADPEQRAHADGAPPPGPVYRVVAVDRDGHELARSAPVAPMRAESREDAAEVSGDDGATPASTG